MNEYDTRRIMEILSGRGWTPTDTPAKADFIFLNTCSIREKAEQKVYSLLGRMRPLKEANPNLVIGVGGLRGPTAWRGIPVQGPIFGYRFRHPRGQSSAGTPGRK